MRSAGTPALCGATRSGAGRDTRLVGGLGEWVCDRHDRPAGEELGTAPADLTAVKVGTQPASPRPMLWAGKMQRLLIAPVWRQSSRSRSPEPDRPSRPDSGPQTDRKQGACSVCLECEEVAVE